MRRSLGRVSLAFAASLALLEPSVRAAGTPADWPHAGADGGQSHRNRLEHRLDGVSLRDLHLVWAAPIRPRAYLYEQAVEPVIVRDGRVFARWGGEAAASTLFALSETTGAVLWSRSFEAGSVEPVAATERTLIADVAVAVHSTTAIDPATGRTRWARSEREPFGTAGGLLRTYAVDRRLDRPRIVCLRTETGRIVWTERVDVRSQGLGGPLVRNGIVVVPVRTDEGPGIAGLRGKDGSPLWSIATQGWPVAVADGIVTTIRWVGPPNGDTVVEAFALRDGSARWTQRVATSARLGAVGGGLLFLNPLVCERGCEGDAPGLHRGGVVALDASTGQEVWRVMGNAWGGPPLWHAGAYADGSVFVARFDLERPTVAALGAWTGRLRWSIAFGPPHGLAQVDVVANRAVLGGTYWGGDDGGQVFRLAVG